MLTTCKYHKCSVIFKKYGEYNFSDKPMWGDTYTTAVFSGGRTGHPPSTVMSLGEERQKDNAGCDVFGGRRKLRYHRDRPTGDGVLHPWEGSRKWSVIGSFGMQKADRQAEGSPNGSRSGAGAILQPKQESVVDRKKRRLQLRAASAQQTHGNLDGAKGKHPATTKATNNDRTGKKKPSKKAKKKNRTRRVRETAAVSLVCKEAATYRDALVKARETINLKELGLETMTVRRGLTGAFIWSITGKKAAAKADRFAEALKRTVPEAKVSRPLGTGTIRLVGMDPGLNATIIRNALLELKGGVNPDHITVGEISAGRGQLGETVVTAPLATIQAALNKGKLSFGWCTARVVNLQQRPLQCHHCLARGHVAAGCPSAVDRSSLCYKCGRPDHVAKNCISRIECNVCRDAGRKTIGHRAGSWECPVVLPRKTGAGVFVSASQRSAGVSVSASARGDGLTKGP
ncbi:hypothetical protein M0804_015081 [Polistes exclamans]|nr:hypothetical protein M0804_015081 [Polistes exclamans]